MGGDIRPGNLSLRILIGEVTIGVSVFDVGK